MGWAPAPDLMQEKVGRQAAMPGRENTIEDVQRLIDRWKSQVDPRLSLCRVRARAVGDVISLEGEVLDSGARSGLMDFLADQIPSHEFDDRLVVMMDSAAPAVVCRAVASVRREPTEKADLLTQGLFGEKVSILKIEQNWAFVRLILDGYLGWMPLHAVAEGTPTPTHVVRAAVAPAYDADEPDRVCGQLPFGSLLAMAGGREEAGGRGDLVFEAPGGGFWQTRLENLTRLVDRPGSDSAGLCESLLLAGRFVGIPYLWGGRSPFGFDCSGLVQAVLGYCGLKIPRDADLQYESGAAVDGAPEPGDLLFFGRPGYRAADIERKGGVNHVALSLGGDEFLHASSAVWGAAYGSLSPDSPRFYPDLAARFLGARRYRRHPMAQPV